MGHQIIKQPDGLFCVWSTVVDAIVVTDASARELEDMYAAEAAHRAAEQTRKIIDSLESGERPYYQFTMTYEEALEQHTERHGPLVDDSPTVDGSTTVLP